MRTFRLLFIFFAFCILTVLTQVGGVVYLVTVYSHAFIRRKIINKYFRQFYKFLVFLVAYLFVTLAILPFLAKPFGRVPLPLTETRNIKPAHILTCLLNRNYVRPELRETAFKVAEQMNSKFPGTKINYLDACFPFINKFPLFPHLSHNDGKKLDLAFCYSDSKTGAPVNNVPSPIGYGICEEPRPEEVNTAALCACKGYWRYSMLLKIVPQGNKANFTFDEKRTKELVNMFAAQSAIGKIFIEPHLKERLGLNTAKIRFHGCGAVRHDDHLHVQLK